MWLQMGNRGMKRLLQKTFTRFALCCLVLFIVTAPLFYLVTKYFYAEDMMDVIMAVENGESIPPLDLEEDIIEGMMLQFLLIFVVLSIALIVTMRIVTKRIWYPFEDTLRKTEDFNVSKGSLPVFKDTDILEFHRLNVSLADMMRRSRETYRIQKEFTENASHELQTPLAVMRSKLDILMQEELSVRQMELISDIYNLNSRMGHLNKSLLLLAKIENTQYDICESISVEDFIKHLIPSYNLLKDGCNVIYIPHSSVSTVVKANSVLFESLLNNLVINAIRHTEGGGVQIIVDGRSLTVKNPASDGALDGSEMFIRFRSGDSAHSGAGIGLSIVKAICDLHAWSVRYDYSDGSHSFTVVMR